MITRLLPIFALACAASAQPPAFEVASVKRSEPITPELVRSGRLQMGATIDARSVRISKLSLFELICLAFQVKGHQVSGPNWMNTERYDIQAKLPEGGRRGQVPAMLQTLLTERFALRLHREDREFHVYTLVVAKGGPRLKPSEAPEAPAANGGPIRGGTSVDSGGMMVSTGPGGDSRVTPGPAGNLHIENKRMTMPGFAGFINRYCDRPVVDRTNLEGAYEMEFDISGEEVRAAAQAHGVALRPPPEQGEGASDPAGVSLASSLKKLGLKLEPAKAPAEVIVVDDVRKVPTEN
jgi:uncharacterized protein (TIGR03435 family)